MNPNILCVIPARFSSQRLPGKPLKLIKGLPLVMWVYNRVREANVFTDVIVATDDQRIYDAAVLNGGKAALTAASHESGTDRVNEVVREFAMSHVVNVQGDEPLVPVQLLKMFAAELKNIDDNSLLTCVAHATIEESASPHVVKAVLRANGEALYFSRAAIPCDYRATTEGARLKHIGIYGFSKAGIARFCALPKGTLEAREKLEQLRALEHGMVIRCLKTEYDGLSIDTASDLAEFRARVGADEVD
ncbi:MAG: 3-deoxy-manno-octulosonate cytidylyltransferase [Chitinivibrionales bacterium]|nr:3-deoxy-manno-octulosonate cytidylyltransferase [Chitinivibrionales bacterium]